ncbi:hypothetical protein EDB81DRAFT_584572, partial [Dactylonectria macrodidyma]
MSTINMIRYYFHKNRERLPEARIRRLITLAYQTARDKELYPRAVFIRSEVHNTTSVDGKRQIDPLGEHVTFSYKCQDHLGRNTHVTCHGYVNNSQTLELRKATYTGEKPDSTKKMSGGVVWP